MPIVWLSTDLTQHRRMAAPPQHHTARTPSQTRGYWARARRFVEGQARRKSRGQTLSCHANEAVWIWIWIWGRHRGCERAREWDWRIDQSKSERGRGKAWAKRLAERNEAGEGVTENRCIECGLTKTKQGWARKKRPFNILVVFFSSLSLSACWKGERREKIWWSPTKEICISLALGVEQLLWMRKQQRHVTSIKRSRARPD